MSDGRLKKDCMKRLGSLFSGYGGLDLAIHSVIESETVFVADICGAGEHRAKCGSPCTILEHRFPDAPNLGDVSKIDWGEWKGKVDILAAGFPCQDVSLAGKRAGLKPGTRTGLWTEVVRAIVELQPELVVLENVLGIYSAPAIGDVEPCTWCVGDNPNGALRALDTVLADLAEIGFNAEWVNLRASDVGAPHHRERWFCVAYPVDREQREPFDLGVVLIESPRGSGRSLSGLLRDGVGLEEETPLEFGAPQSERAKALSPVFGKYSPAIARWERVLQREVPDPIHENKNGRPKLNPRFSEWIMGVPDGWICDVPGIRRLEILKACGNGVVPPQASTALTLLLSRLGGDVSDD